MSADFKFAPVCLDTPAELPDLADRIEHTAPADCVAELAASVTTKVDWKAAANEYRDLADFFKGQAYQTAAQLAQARMEVYHFRHRLIAAGLLAGDSFDVLER